MSFHHGVRGSSVDIYREGKFLKVTQLGFIILQTMYCLAKEKLLDDCDVYEMLASAQHAG